jgi:DNA-binding NtrC family response regulator
VDFDGDWRAVAAAFFQEAGGNVVTANYAIDAIVQTAEIRLDLAILDLNRDLESGLELLKFLEVHQPDARVIQYTRQDQDDETAMVMRDLCRIRYVRKGHLDDLRRAAQTAFQE